MCFSFFFSSRRRHTRYWRDWSSDVCSSDLGKYFLDKDATTASYAAQADDLLVTCRRNAEAPASDQVLVLVRSEEHTSELQSRQYLVCRLLLEKKKESINKSMTSSSQTY